MYLVVAYDIVNNSARRKLHRALDGWLERVQKSVFEGEIAPNRYRELIGRIEEVIDREHDTIRVYSLCRRCGPQTEIIGTGSYVDETDRDIIL